MQRSWSRRSPGAAACTEEHVRGIVENAAAGRGDVVLAADSDAFRRAQKTAHDFVKELELRSWVAKQNLQKGLAPSNGSIWDRRKELPSPAATAPFAAPERSVSRLRSRNQWLARWARRWGLKRAWIPAGDVLSASVLRQKAELCESEPWGVSISDSARTRLKKKGVGKRPPKKTSRTPQRDPQPGPTQAP